VDTYSGARPFKQRTFHLRIFTIESSETLIRIYRAYSQQEEVRAHPQNPTERPAIHRSAYERIDLPPIVMSVRSFRSTRTAAIVGSSVATVKLAVSCPLRLKILKPGLLPRPACPFGYTPGSPFAVLRAGGLFVGSWAWSENLPRMIMHQWA
jgi:hypothetical protein